MEDSTFAEKLQDHSSYPRLCPDVYNADSYTFCRWAKTVTGFDVNSEKFVVVAVTCKRWGCPYCATRKIKRLAWMSRNATPNRLVTTTVSSKRYGNGKAAWDATSKAFPELIRYLRQTFGDTEYLRVLELQENGMPHFHCMLRSPFIPQGPVVHEWRRLIGQPTDAGDKGDRPKEWAGVNVKKIDDTFRTFRYLVKYLTKLHKIPWTDRHVSYSRNFFRPEDKEEVAYAKLDSIEQHDQHPWIFLKERYDWDTVTVLGDGKWELDAEIQEPQHTVDPTSLGLPKKTPDEPKLPIEQRLIPGIEQRDLIDETAHLTPEGKTKRRRRKPKPTETNPVPF